MATASKLLPWLLGGAIAAGGWLQGLHWRAAGGGDERGVTNARIDALEDQLAALKRENETLRQQSKGGVDLAVPPELITRIEKEFELTFPQPPVIRRSTADELRDRIAASIESRYGPAGLDNREAAYRLIGWLRPEDKLLPQLTAVRSLGARTWFDDVSGEGWVTDKFDAQAVPDQAALARLLTRMLIHSQTKVPADYPGDDAWRATEALHHGFASGAETRFFAANARAIGFMPLKENNESEQLLASLSPFLQGVTTFPALQGKGLADTSFIRGPAAVKEALARPPATTRQVIHPDPPAQPVTLDLPRTPGEPILEESGGELGVQLWLAPLEDEAKATLIAAEWRADRYRLFPDGEDLGVIWDIRFATASGADQWLAQAGDLLATESGREGAIPPGQAVENPEGRQLILHRISQEVVRYVNVARAGSLPALAP